MIRALATATMLTGVAWLACASVDGGANEPTPPQVEPSPRDAGAAQAHADASSSAADATPTPKRRATIEMTFVGDVMFGRYVKDGRKTIPAGDYNIFAAVEELLAADIVIANLETPVLADLPRQSPYGLRLRFGATLGEARHLVAGGFTAVTLANNHSYDLRLRGLSETPARIRELGLTPLGVSRLDPPTFRADTITHDGWRIAFIAITTERNGPQRKHQPELPFVDDADDIPAVLLPVIEEARASHDLVVVLAHWGKEYMDEPWKSQSRAAHALIDAGADLIIGHHPHVLQAFEAYKDGFIAYSLGNFRFDNARATQNLTGVLRVRFSASPACRERVTFHPAHMQVTTLRGARVHRPAPARGAIGTRVRKRVRDKSAAVGTHWQVDGNDLVLVRPCPQ